MKKDTYSVEVIGFSQTELMALASVFDLSSRRVPKFVRHTTVGTLPDILLVDANDIEAVRLLGERNASGQIPTIMIGDSNRGTNWPLLARPIRWMKLFQAFDVAIGSPASETPKPVAAAPVAASAVVQPGVQTGAVSPAMPAAKPAMTVGEISGARIHEEQIGGIQF
jgi:hypothetical protein